MDLHTFGQPRAANGQDGRFIAAAIDDDQNPY
jgi:hypothetical protein